MIVSFYNFIRARAGKFSRKERILKDDFLSNVQWYRKATSQEDASAKNRLDSLQ